MSVQDLSSGTPSSLILRSLDLKSLAHDTEKPGDVHDGCEHPQGLKLVFISIAFKCFAIFPGVLDNDITPTAILRITDQFKSLDGVGWHGNAHVSSIHKGFWRLRFQQISSHDGCLGEIGNVGILTGASTVLWHTVPSSKRPTYTALLAMTFGIAGACGW
ncbi:MFS toxin efflux pump [Mycena venus]|uniref:MFS toxin efflux pump n=1 Tax=Mycena venus TaxID=2733690 RepID=A0A8H6Z1H9_9AGAR|nr:MFS toxin efflux pump [Mycena venus]